MSSTNAVEAAKYADLELACLCNLSLAWIKLGSMAKAEEACCRALLRWPSNAKALFRRGQARLALGRPLEAVADFREVSVQEPANIEATKMLQRAREDVRCTMPPEVDLDAQQGRGVHDGGLTSSTFLAETSVGGEGSTEDKKHVDSNNTAMVHEATTNLASSCCENSERLSTSYLPHHVESSSPNSGRVVNASEEADKHSRPEDGISTDTHGVSSFMVSDWLNSAEREEAERKVMDKRKPLFTGDAKQDVPISMESCDENNAAIDAKNGGGDASVSRLVSQLKTRKASQQQQQQQQESPRTTRTPKEEAEWSRLKAEEMDNVQMCRQRYEESQAGMSAKAASGRILESPENSCAKKGGQASSGEAAGGNRTAMQTSQWASLEEEEKQVRDAFRAKLCIRNKKNTKKKKKNAVSRMRAEVPP